MSEVKILRRVIVVCGVLMAASIVTSIFDLDFIPSPDDWLIGWTSWIGSVVAIVVAARIFWIGRSTLDKLLKKGRLCGKKGDNERAT